MSTNPTADAGTSGAPLATTLPVGMLWLVGTTLVALFVLYLIGVDQGATSIFGSDMHIHEFVHDARHLLGFPCH